MSPIRVGPSAFILGQWCRKRGQGKGASGVESPFWRVVYLVRPPWVLAWRMAGEADLEAGQGYVCDDVLLIWFLLMSVCATGYLRFNLNTNVVSGQLVA